MTARGKMAIVGIDDSTTRIEVVVGNELLNQSQQLLKDDQLVIVEGRVSNDDFSPSMMLGVFYIHPKDSLTTIELMDKMHAFRMALTPDTQENDKILSIGLSFANSNKS